VEIPRGKMSLFINVLSGCDFVTPHNHARKPRCKFCGAEKIDWIHLLFNCRAIESGHIFFNYVLLSVKNSEILNGHPKRKILIRTLARLWNKNHYKDLFLLILGANLEKFDLLYENIMNVLVRTAVSKFAQINADWLSIEIV
jgi:hypothetical protein